MADQTHNTSTGIMPNCGAWEELADTWTIIFVNSATMTASWKSWSSRTGGKIAIVLQFGHKNSLCGERKRIYQTAVLKRR